MKHLFGSIIFLTAAVWSYGQANRVIDFPRIATEPTAADVRGLEMIGIKVNGTSVSLGQPFSADGDWLKALTVTVKNISEKPISSIRVSFILPETKDAQGMSQGFSLDYGIDLSTGISSGPEKVIAPGQEIELKRNEAHYTRDCDGIAKRSGMTDFNSVLIANTVVKFEDGTTWTTYKLPLAIPRASKTR